MYMIFQTKNKLQAALSCAQLAIRVHCTALIVQYNKAVQYSRALIVQYNYYL